VTKGGTQKVANANYKMDRRVGIDVRQFKRLKILDTVEVFVLNMRGWLKC